MHILLWCNSSSKPISVKQREMFLCWVLNWGNLVCAVSPSTYAFSVRLSDGNRCASGLVIHDVRTGSNTCKQSQCAFLEIRQRTKHASHQYVSLNNRLCRQGRLDKNVTPELSDIGCHKHLHCPVPSWDALGICPKFWRSEFEKRLILKAHLDFVC
jgi:hypothetical protein